MITVSELRRFLDLIVYSESNLGSSQYLGWFMTTVNAVLWCLKATTAITAATAATATTVTTATATASTSSSSNSSSSSSSSGSSRSGSCSGSSDSSDNSSSSSSSSNTGGSSSTNSSSGSVWVRVCVWDSLLSRDNGRLRWRKLFMLVKSSSGSSSLDCKKALFKLIHCVCS